MARGWVSMVAVLAIVLASCGGGGSDTGSPETTAKDAGAATTQPVTSGGLVCEDPPPMPMAFGETVQGENGPEAYTICHVVEVPAGVETLTISLSGLSDDLSLVAGFGDIEAVRSGFDWMSAASGTADETIVIDQPEPGTYFIKIGPGTVKNVSPYTLSVTGS